MPFQRALILGGIEMLVDLRSDSLTSLEGDVAIIGAGAAGITIARRLLSAGKHVILLESGGLDYEKDTASLNAGKSVGQDYYDLEDARLRFFGGTTAIWGGRSTELDPIDFEARPWVPHSGWPFGISELRRWYDEAYQLLGLAGHGSGAPTSSLEGFGFEELSVRHWLFDRKFDRFGHAANRDLLAHPKLRAVMHATVREIVAADSGKTIESLDVRDLGGKRLTVRARNYVLAAGGLENPRILLASTSVAPKGIGNDHDLVGRFFMEHPHARGGKIVGGPAWKLLSAFRTTKSGGVPCASLVAPSADMQRELGILNSCLTIAARPKPEGRHPVMKQAYLYARHKVAPSRRGRLLWKSHRWVNRHLGDLLGHVPPWWYVATGQKDLTLFIRAEQSPNFDSRVMLDGEVDATGMPRIRLDWRMQDIDIRSVSALVDATGRELQRLDLGQIVKAGWLESSCRKWVSDPLVSTHAIGGYHHMGTTRMSANPRQGVTDECGRVHGISNLHVAGSSLFPTGGWANPTLTILALALRTADRIAIDMGS